MATNLFGEEQPEILTEREYELRKKIRVMVEDNLDYEFLCYELDGEIASDEGFEDFFKEQIAWLVEFHDKCKNWEEFTERYYYKIKDDKIEGSRA